MRNRTSREASREGKTREKRRSGIRLNGTHPPLNAEAASPRLPRDTRGWSATEMRLLRKAEEDGRASRWHARAFWKFLRKYAFLLAVVLLSALILSFFLYSRVLPQRYDVRVGEASTVDISTRIAVVDRAATQRRADQAASKVPAMTKRSESLSNESMDRLKLFLGELDRVRTDLAKAAKTGTTVTPEPTPATPATPATPEAPQADETPGTTPAAGEAKPSAARPSEGVPASNAGTAPLSLTSEQIDQASDTLIRRAKENFGFTLGEQDAKVLVSLQESFYQDLRKQTETLGRSILGVPLDAFGLEASITMVVGDLVNSREVYKEEYKVVGPILRAFLRPNVVYDASATEQAQEAERARILNDPIMIPAGTRIINKGQIVSQDDYDLLQEMNMIDVPGLDFGLLLPIFVLLLATLFMTAVYLVQRQAKAFTVSGMRFFLLLVIDGAMLGEIYLGSMLPQASLIFCLAIILTIQMDFECGYVVGNLALLALLPLRLASTAALLPIFLGLPVVVYMADRMKRTNGTATLIFLSALSPFVSALLYGLVLHDAVSMSGQNAIIVGISGGLSAILAIGLQPILELITDSVSASRLIRLSQPSQALLRRLFLEAPGTYQHSMMVANLAEKAAETVGADTLLVRVGTYYHDIGKMAHPDVFTENQTDYNPHQFLRPEESVKLILGHVDLGVRTARRFRLPERLQDFIREHHGNTLQASFYAKACENAQREGRPLPKESDFRYPGPMPRSKETAIVMLADSLEAAIRSTKTTTIQGAEEIARKIVRIKTEQDQLVNSGLSYYEVEQIIQAFVKVYRGQFHERVAYPEVPKPKPEILVTAEAKEEEQEAEKPEPVVDAGKETPVSAPAGGDELRPGRGI